MLSMMHILVEERWLYLYQTRIIDLGPTTDARFNNVMSTFFAIFYMFSGSLSAFPAYPCFYAN